MSALPGTTGRRRIYLMRHGHVDYFSEAVKRSQHLDEVPLTELGREQVTAAAQALSHVTFDRAVCSGLPHTRETAKLVLDQQANSAPNLEVREELKEINTGRPMKIISREQLAALMAFHFDNAAQEGAELFEDGEKFADAYERAVRGIETLLVEPNWHSMLVTAHEGTNRLLLGWATGNGLNAIQAFEQDLACINILDFDLVPREDGEGTQIERKIIKAVNLTPYNFVKHCMNLTSIETIFAKL